MSARIDPTSTEIAPQVMRHLGAAHQALSRSSLPPATQALVEIRASQINGCGWCLDMHTKEALAAGESAQRLHLLAGWRDTDVFTDAERAALELTEQGTRVADAGQVTDEAWAAAAEHYDEEQLMALVHRIALINAFNRLNIITGRRGGDYQVG